MAVIDPTYLSRERNHFPELTDAEFETLCLFSQTLGFKDIASYRGSTERQARKHMDSCRKKLCSDNDSEMLFSFMMKILDENFFPEQLTDEQSSLLCLYALTGNQTVMATLLNYSKEEIRFQLMSIKDALGVRDIYSTRLYFLMKIIFFA